MPKLIGLPLMLSHLGLVLESLFWLTILGMALFLVTCVWGWL